MIILHVLIALSSVIFTSYTYLQPSTEKLQVAYGLVGATLATGVYLVWVTPSHMLTACMSGLLYVAIVSLGIVAAKSKLAGLQAEKRAK